MDWMWSVSEREQSKKALSVLALQSCQSLRAKLMEAGGWEN